MLPNTVWPTTIKITGLNADGLEQVVESDSIADPNCDEEGPPVPPGPDAPEGIEFASLGAVCFRELFPDILWSSIPALHGPSGVAFETSGWSTEHEVHYEVGGRANSGTPPTGVVNIMVTLGADAWPANLHIEGFNAAGDPVEFTSGYFAQPNCDDQGNRIDAPASPGGKVVFEGSGFKPDSDVELWLFSDPIFLMTATAGATGSFSVEVEIPSGVTGAHTIVASGVDPDGNEYQQTMTVVIQDIVTEVDDDDELPLTGLGTIQLVLAALLLMAGGWTLIRRTKQPN